MKKKLISLLVTAAMAASLLAGCGSSSSSKSDTSSDAKADTAENSDASSDSGSDESAGEIMKAIKERGKLIVGTASGYPPYEFVDVTDPNQTVIGVDMELAKAIADELGVELEIQDMDFSALLSSLPAKKIDMAIAGIAPTDERKESMDFSDNYLDAKQVFIINKSDADKYKDINAFKGQPLAAEKSTTQEALVQELFPDSKLTSLEKVPDCILELKSGNVAGVCVESIVGEQYILSDDTLAFADAETGRDKYSAIAMEKGNEDLLTVVNSVIKEHKDNGDFDKWVEEYSKKAAENAK